MDKTEWCECGKEQWVWHWHRTTDNDSPIIFCSVCKIEYNFIELLLFRQNYEMLLEQCFILLNSLREIDEERVIEIMKYTRHKETLE